MRALTSHERDQVVIRFSTYELDVRAGELRKQGVRIKLQEQPFRILEMLLANPGQVVTREESSTRAGFGSGEQLVQGRGGDGLDQVALDPGLTRELAAGVRTVSRQCNQPQVLQLRML